MPELSPAEWMFLATLATFGAFTAWMIWWPRAHYESKNPNLRGEDYWNPLRGRQGKPFSRGPLPRFHTTGEKLLERKARAQLRSAPGLDATDVLVRVRGHEAWLLGHVPSEEEKLLAARVARATEGISLVRNELSVQPFPDWIKDAA